MLQVAEDTLVCRDCRDYVSEDRQAEGSYDEQDGRESCLCVECWRDREITYAENFEYDDPADVA